MSTPDERPRFDEALQYAVEAHGDQTRKGTGVPYVSHLLGVASLVLYLMVRVDG